MNNPPRFMTDAAGAGLARWLRLLGFDTIIYAGQAGRSMMRLAQSQKRILLTRRRDIMDRQFSGYRLLLPDAAVEVQLRFVVESLSLKIHREKMHTLCLTCNETLEELDKENARDLAPPFVLDHSSRINRCRTCGKIFWPGTHRLNALAFLKRNNIKVIGD